MGQLTGPADATDERIRRRRVRHIAAALSVATALLYFLIGVGVLTVVAGTAKDAPPMLVFGASAGAAFMLGAVLLLAFDNRALWILGALFQVGVVVMYLNVSAQRTPPFEIWGILIKILQVAILGALVYLLVRSPQSESRSGPTAAAR
ncbi:MAG: hypothetical protein ACXWM8_07445 [Candidatus Limnocylindrales bacterium]